MPDRGATKRLKLEPGATGSSGQAPPRPATARPSPVEQGQPRARGEMTDMGRAAVAVGGRALDLARPMEETRPRAEENAEARQPAEGPASGVAHVPSAPVPSVDLSPFMAEMAKIKSMLESMQEAPATDATKQIEALRAEKRVIIDQHRAELEAKDAEIVRLRQQIEGQGLLYDKLQAMTDELSQQRASLAADREMWNTACKGLYNVVKQVQSGDEVNGRLRAAVREAERKEREARVAEKAADERLVALDQIHREEVREVEEASHEWKGLYQEAEEARAVEVARLEDERDTALTERDDFERRLDEAEAIIDDQVDDVIAGQAARRKARKGDDDEAYVPSASRQPRSPKKDKKGNEKKDSGRMVNGKGKASARSRGLAGASTSRDVSSTPVASATGGSAD